MTLSVFASACSRESAESDLLGDTADTFPKLLLEHARVRPGPAGQSREGLRHLACLSWAEVIAEVEALARPA